MAFPAFKSSRASQRVRWVGLGIVAMGAFHAISTLVLAVLGVAPGSENWSLLLTLAGVLAVSGAAVGMQSYLYAKPDKQHRYRLLGTVSGAASGAVLGFFVGGQLGDQAARWAITGLVIGSILLVALAWWSYQLRPKAPDSLSEPVALSKSVSLSSSLTQKESWSSFCGSAIALSSGLCAYGLAFGLGAWTFMALSVGRIGLAGLLSLLTVLYLWLTRRALKLMRALSKHQ